MAIDKPMTPSLIPEMMDDFEDEEVLEIEVVNPDAITIEEDDGSVTVIMDPDMQEDIIGPDHNSNFAEFLDEDELDSIGSELVDQFNSDRESRKDWARVYMKGLDLLGLKIEDRDQPWPGACGVYHPVLIEAVVRFQAQAITELFPAGGPVRTKIMGHVNEEKIKQASRV